MDRDAYEELFLQAHELVWTLLYRRDEGPRFERLFWRAMKRYDRRGRALSDYDLMRMESAIEAQAYEED